MDDITTVGETGGNVSTPEDAASVSGEELESQPETEGEGEESEETEEGGEEEEKPKKLTANERIQQLVAEKNALKDQLSETATRIQALEDQFKAKVETQQPDYIEITPDVTVRINDHLAHLRQQQAEAEQSGNYLAAVQAQKEIEQIYNGLQENENRRQQAALKQQEAAKGNQIAQALDQRAEFYRQANNIPAEVWHEGGNWFTKQCETDPILRQKFVDLVHFGSPMAAIEFAANYVQQNMSAPADKAKAQREQAKSKVPSGGGNSSAATKELSDDLPYKEWVKLRNEQLANRHK